MLVDSPRVTATYPSIVLELWQSIKFKEKESMPCDGLVLSRLWLASRVPFLWSHKELTGLSHRQGNFKNLLCDCAYIRLG